MHGDHQTDWPMDRDGRHIADTALSGHAISTASGYFRTGERLSFSPDLFPLCD